MRKSRLTFKDAYHHVLSRGINGEPILAGKKCKEYFLHLLKASSRNLRIRLLAYCLMSNHYHLILQNSSGRLADFMRQLNGQYGLFYRGEYGGRGYVFQDRFKSTLIQQDNYLKMAIIYVLLNPVRARLVSNPYAYRWSSIDCYFGDGSSDIVSGSFVAALFGDKKQLDLLLREWLGRELTIIRTRVGDVLGEQWFVKEAMRNFERRKKSGASLRMRKSDYIFEPAGAVIKRFEQDKGIKMDVSDVNTVLVKKLRAELLVWLRERAGLRYKEIIKLPLFHSLKYSSLGQLYKRAKKVVNKG